jgi:hypothetical protein
MKATMPVTIKKKGAKKKAVFQIEFNADRFERVAAALGMFSEEFLESLDRAEQEVKAGKTKRLRSLRDLR